MKSAIRTILQAELGALERVPEPKAAASDPTPEQKLAYQAIPICRVCAERHPFICPYVRKVVLDNMGAFRVIELRDEFYADYLAEVPHGPADIEVG